MVIEYKLVIIIGFHFRPVDILYFVKKAVQYTFNGV